MKIITWKELLELQGDIVWSYYGEYDFTEEVTINYGYEDKPVQRLCEERFPITTPEIGGCPTASTSEIFAEVGEASVSDLETSGDIVNRESPDTKVIIYDQKDIDSWKVWLLSIKDSDY